MEITFNYIGEELKTICNDTKQKINDIFHNLKNEVEINSILFLYSGMPIDGNLSIVKIVNNLDAERKKMSILVTDKKDDSEKPCWIHSKDIICPKCGEAAKFDINEYKLILQCKNGHNMGNIFLDEYENTQKIDISKIICDVCKTTNKSTSYKNIFYRCNQCEINLCVNCQNKHQNENIEHNFINYDNKNYICPKHNEKYSSFCEDCQKNTCLYCQTSHKEEEEKDNKPTGKYTPFVKPHIFINFVKLLPDMKSAKNNLDELKNKINQFKEKIEDIIKRL